MDLDPLLKIQFFLITKIDNFLFCRLMASCAKFDFNPLPRGLVLLQAQDSADAISQMRA